MDRGVQMTLSTNDDGEYVASPLHIGRYKIRVEKTGFKSAVSEVVELNVQGRVAINRSIMVTSAQLGGRYFKFVTTRIFETITFEDGANS